MNDVNKLFEDYKYALDQSAIIAITDEKGIILTVNDKFCARTKYDRKELIGKTHAIINSKYHPKEFFKDMWDIITAGNIWRGEIKNKTKDGEYYWVYATIIPFLDNNKTSYQYLSIRFDITQRKNAEELLIESEATHKAFFDNSIDAIILIGPDGALVSANPAACKLFGGSEKQICLAGRVNLIDQTDPRFWAYIKEREETKTTEAKATFIKLDGTKFEAEIKSSIFEDSINKKKTYVIIRDITERKKAEELIIEKAFQLEMLSNNLPESAIHQGVRDEAGKMKFTYISNGIKNLINKTSEEIIQDASVLFNLIYKDDRQKFAEAVAISFQNTCGLNVDVRYYHSSGEIRWTQIRSTPRKLNGGKIIWDGIFSDITNRKKMEQGLINNERMLNTVFEKSPIGKEVFDKNFFLIKANKKIDEILGIDADALVGIYNLRADPNYNYREIWEKIDKGIQVEHEIEYDFNKFAYSTRKSGVVYLQLTMTPISDEACESIGCIIQLIDVTERKQYDHKILKAIIKTQEEERFEIGCELHDNICQMLVAAQISLGILNKTTASDNQELYNEIKKYIKLSIDGIRDFSHRLTPAFFSTSKLGEEVKNLINSFRFDRNIKVRQQIEIDTEKYKLSPELQLNLYRILQEQLNNIYKYSKATVIDVDLRIVNNQLIMIVMDNGIGFDILIHTGGIGIANMRRRVEIFAGKIEIHSSPGNGCLIRIDIPVKENDKNSVTTLVGY